MTLLEEKNVQNTAIKACVAKGSIFQEIAEKVSLPS